MRRWTGWSGLSRDTRSLADRRSWAAAAALLATVVAASPALARHVLPAEGSPVARCVAAAYVSGVLVDVPDGLMGNIALAETGRPDVDGAYRPWPWSIDADGADYVFVSEPQAIAFARLAPSRGVRFLDAGCLQVNLQYHPHAFATLADAFDPYDNARYAARYLRELYDTDAARDWSVAVGMYHSHQPDLAAEYRDRVAALGAGIIRGITPGPLAHQMALLGLVRLQLSNGHTLALLLRRQPTAPGHPRPNPCRVAAALAPEMSPSARLRVFGCH